MGCGAAAPEAGVRNCVPLLYTEPRSLGGAALLPNSGGSVRPTTLPRAGGLQMFAAYADLVSSFRSARTVWYVVE